MKTERPNHFLMPLDLTIKTETMDISPSSASSGGSPEIASPDAETIRRGFHGEYNLRHSSVINRIECERKRELPKQRKVKTKAPSLSKYRRRAANARERGRMQEMNVAFIELQSVVPDFTTVDPLSKLTKITTLRLALNYIAALRGILGYESENQPGTSSMGSAGSDGEFSQYDSLSDGMKSPVGSGLDSEGEYIMQS